LQLKALILFAHLFVCQILVAQLYDKTWVCGTHGGTITFNDDGTIDTFRFYPYVNCRGTWASMCNRDGEFQFFTEGVNVYSFDGVRMVNGKQLSDNEVNSHFYYGLPDYQNALILPKRDKEYYIVYQGQSDFAYSIAPWYYTDRLYYSVVDMSLDNGRGDVTQKRIQVNDNRFMDGKMTACQHANGRDWWLVQRRYNANSYFIYLVTPDGITLKSEQYIGAVSSEPDAVGQSAFSPDGSKYASITGKSPLIILDFDRCEGVFSNPVKIEIPVDTVQYLGTVLSGGGGNGLCFSPNNRFLYMATIYIVRQFDLQENPLDSTVIALWTDTINFGKFNQMQLGPNGKLYIAPYQGVTKAIHVIHNPDEKGLACNFEKFGQRIASINAFAIPNLVHYRMGALIGSGCDTISTSIKDAEPDSKVRLYPNPAKGIVQIDLSSYNHYNPNNVLYLYNNEGKLVQQVQVPYLSAQMDVSTLPAGIYQWSLGTANKPVATGSLNVVK
jgi:hypothetical protein